MIEKHTETVGSMSSPMVSLLEWGGIDLDSLPVRSLSFLSVSSRGRAGSVVKVTAPEPQCIHLLCWTRYFNYFIYPFVGLIPYHFKGSAILYMPPLIVFTLGYGPAIAVWKRFTGAACSLFISLWLFQAPSPQVPRGGWLQHLLSLSGFPDLGSLHGNSH